jgi:hypothetical protein
VVLRVRKENLVLKMNREGSDDIEGTDPNISTMADQSEIAEGDIEGMDPTYEEKDGEEG